MTKSGINLASMSVDALLDLREEIGNLLNRRAGELKRQLQRLEAGASRDSKHNLPAKAGTNTKVAPKYRGPGGETWAGRGLQPRWLQSLLKQGHKLEEFAIDRALASRKKSAVKKSRRNAKAAAAKRKIVSRRADVTLN
jgi:DNA-binding protein H-NS